MRWFFDRRGFVRSVVAGAAALGLGACEGEGDAGPGDAGPGDAGPGDAGQGGADGGVPEDVFPQGLASGDPQPDRVILWTRVAPPQGGGTVEVAFVVAEDEALTAVVAEGRQTVGTDTDHTLRLRVTGLAAHRHYYFQFSARGDTSEVGRTKTAPSALADTPVRFALASCQDYNGRYYHAWAELAAAEDDLDFVLFLGDYIYETAGDARFQEAGGRQVEIPDGLPISETGVAAISLADYRALYRQFKADPDLRRAHARFPFVTIWDDHEFADDCWRDRATHFNDRVDEQDTARRTAANQAWFEYIPCDLERDGAASFPDDLRIERSLRFGRHAELALTDLRSHRDDHVIPEGPVNVDVGKLEPNSAIGSRQFALKSAFDALEASSGVSMLGAAQRAWLVETLRGSTATWKLWGSSVMLTQMVVDLSRFESLPEQYRDAFYFSLDQWDGYRSERAAVLEALAGVTNLVTLVGDIHGHYASELHVDFDAPSETPAAVELVCAGIASRPLQAITIQTLERNATLSALGLVDIARAFDREVRMANDHIRYTDNLANGYVRVDLSEEAVQATFVRVEGVATPERPGPARRTRFRVAAGTARLVEV